MNSDDVAKFHVIKDDIAELSIKSKLLEELVKKDLHAFKMNTARNSDATEARKFLQTVAKEVQKNLEGRISELVSVALLAVFGSDAPKFVCEFVERRNVMECDLFLEKNGRRYAPTEGGGGGPADVADFALRIAYWSLNKNRPSFVLDEPFKFVSNDLQGAVSDMLKMLCDKLNLQIIMVSHQRGVNALADKTISVDQENDISTVKEIS